MTYPAPSLGSVVPVSVSPGPFSLTVNGSGFVNGAKVLWNGAPLAIAFVSSAKVMATGTASQVGSVGITVANPGPTAVSTALALNVTPSVSVVVAPSGASVTPGATKQFQATVTGSANQSVTWGVVGSPAAGAITGNGVYTAPAVAPVAGLATVYAVAVADGVTKGSATIAIQDPLAISYGRFLEGSKRLTTVSASRSWWTMPIRLTRSKKYSARYAR